MNNIKTFSRILLIIVILTMLILPVFQVSTVSATTPSIVATPAFPTSDIPAQKRCFYSAGLFWAFYHTEAGGSDGISYKTSIDGSTWSLAILIRNDIVNLENCWSIYYDGTYVHYVYLSDVIGSLGGLGYYRRGTPQSDGSIVWSAAEQTSITPGAGNALYFPVITVDTAGHPWIGYLENGDSYEPKVTTSSTADGTWSTLTDFPYTLSVGGLTQWVVIPLPQTGGNIYCIYGTEATTPKGKIWDGTWGLEEITTDLLSSYERYTAISDGDKIEFVMSEDAVDDIKYYEWDTSWSEATILLSGGDGAYLRPTLCFSSSGVYYCFFTGEALEMGHYYYKVYSGGVWSADPIDFINESVYGFTVNSVPMVSYKRDNGYISVLYAIGSDPDITLKFAYLESLTAPTVDDGSAVVSTNPSYQNYDVATQFMLTAMPYIAGGLLFICAIWILRGG